MKSTWSKTLAKYLKAEYPLSPVEWANRNLVLPDTSTEPGRYRTSRTPYVEEILSRMAPDDPAEIVVFMKGSQVGATTVMLAQLGWCVTENPAPIMFINPTIQLAQRTAKQKINPLIRDTPVLKDVFGDPASKTGENSMLEKKYPGGTFLLTGSNSGPSLRSMNAKFIFGDEIDEFTEDVADQGDPLGIIFSRAKSYGRKRKIVLASTPKIKDASHIERWFNAGDRRYFHVPCPHCGHMDHLKWANVKFDKDNVDDTHMVCEECGGRIDEHHKTKMLANGEWRATAQTTQKGLYSYHLNSLYSPLGWYSWADMVQEFLQAKKQGKEALKAWINLQLGETFEDQTVKVDENKLLARRVPYPADLPEQVYFLTCGVDTQDDRLEATVLGWGKDENCYIIDHKVCWGDPDSVTPWTELDGIINSIYKKASGKGYRIRCTFVDSGGHKTQSVYDQCKLRKNVWAIKGMGGESRPVVARSTSKNRRESEELLIVGIDQIKSLLYSRLAMNDTTAYGYVHIPLRPRIDESYIKSLVSEKQVARRIKGRIKYEWIPTHKRNEGLDCWVYGYGAMVWSNPDWEAFEKVETGTSSNTNTKPKKKRLTVRKSW